MSKQQIKFEFLETFTQLETNELGLSSKEALYRLKKFGPNTTEKINPRTTINKLLKNFTNPLILILLFITILSLIIGKTTDTLTIFTITIINYLIKFYQQNTTEKKLKTIKKFLTPKTTVFRDGKLTNIDTIKIVPGDIILLKKGDIIPSDGIIIESNNFKTNESLLTGKSTPITKQNFNSNLHSTFPIQKTNTVFMGTFVVEGSAKFVVTATGKKTEFNKIRNFLITTQKTPSLLEEKINQLNKLSIFLNIIFISLIFGLNYFFKKIHLTENLLFSISIFIISIPEIFTTITTSLAISVQKLSQKKAIIKEPYSIETLASTTIICINKTGILTRDEMSISNIYCDNTFIFVKENQLKFFNDHKELTNKDLINNPFNQSFETLLKCFILCNNSTFNSKTNHYLGNRIEKSLLKFSTSIHNQPEQIKNDFIRLQEFPFNSNNKKMSVIVQHKKTGKIYVFSKGAPEEILKQSDQILQKNRPTILSEQNRLKILTINNQFSTNKLYCLAFSYKELPQYYKSNQNPPTQKEIEQNQTFIGLCGMTNPPKKHIKKALQMSTKAGIRTIILTGDQAQTTKTIAKQIEFFKSESELNLISGEEIDKLNHNELSTILKNLNQKLIFYKIKPEHKLKIVNLLKSQNEIVAITGSKIDDTPILKEANIGIAIGSTKTKITTETAKVIINDNNFYTILKAIKESRVIYQNITKLISYIFTTNLGKIICILFSIFLNLPLPLTTILILIINLTTNPLSALALNFEPPEANIFLQKSHNPNSKIFDRNFIIRTFYLSSIIGILSISIFLFFLTKEGWLYGEKIADPTHQKAISACFTTLVFLQLFNSLNYKSSTNSILNSSIIKNKHLIFSIIFSSIITITIIQLPFLNQILKTHPLNLTEWTIIILTSFLIIPLEEIRKKFQSKN